MNNKTVKKGSVFLKIINAISLTILCLYFVFQKNNILYYVFLFFGTVAFQLDLKVVLGGILMKSIKPNFDLAKKRYHISAFEFKILNFLGVKKWKDKWITVYKNQFYLDNGKNQDRIYTVFQNNIKSEIIHVVLFFLGFINVLIGYFLLHEFFGPIELLHLFSSLAPASLDQVQNPPNYCVVISLYASASAQSFPSESIFRPF